jgi:hypothetical protein
MLSVVMLSVILLSVVILSAIMLSVFILSVIMLNVFILSVIMPSVMAPAHPLQKKMSLKLFLLIFVLMRHKDF